MKPNTTNEGIERATLYFSPRDNVFLVMAEAPNGFSTIEIGVPVKIMGVEFEENIARVLRRTLDSFRANSPTDAVPKSAADYSSFQKAHLSVSIERILSTGETRIIPRHRLQGGYGGRRAEQIVVTAAEFDAQIASLLRRAFANAT